MDQIDRLLAPPATETDTADRRRPGRPAFDNPHLIAVLRVPGAVPSVLAPCGKAAAAARVPFIYVLLAAVGFWVAAVVALARL
jgi:hypothetical protein